MHEEIELFGLPFVLEADSVSPDLKSVGLNGYRLDLNGNPLVKIYQANDDMIIISLYGGVKVRLNGEPLQAACQIPETGATIKVQDDGQVEITT